MCSLLIESFLNSQLGVIEMFWLHLWGVVMLLHTHTLQQLPEQNFPGCCSCSPEQNGDEQRRADGLNHVCGAEGEAIVPRNGSSLAVFLDVEKKSHAKSAAGTFVFLAQSNTTDWKTTAAR